MNRYFARSASDNTEDWPFWLVADLECGKLNVTADLIREYVDPNHKGAVFTDRDGAKKLADVANGKSGEEAP